MTAKFKGSGGARALDRVDAFARAGVESVALAATGIGVGIALAVYLRRRELAPSWLALGAVPFSVLAAIAATGVLPGEAALGALIFVGAAVVGGVGYGGHAALEDRRAGGDREIRRRRRRGVLDPLRRRLRERGRRHRAELAAGVPVGRTHRGELALVPRGDARSGAHVLIPGATGSGKTTSLAALLVDYVAGRSFGAVVLEAKTDEILFRSARAAARARGVRFHFVSPSGPASYDPLAHGSVDERSERLIAVEGWGSSDADFYRQAASPFLRLVLRLLDASELKVTLGAVADHCDPDRLLNLAQDQGDPALATEAATAVDGLSRDQRRAVSGLSARLQNIASSEFARDWLDPESGTGGLFDLRAAIARREVAYFRFDTDRTGNVGRALAQMVLLDLGAAASALMGRGVGTFVGVDEFGALEASAMERLFVRGRAAGLSVALGTQTLADLLAAGDEARARIGATVSGLVCHRIGEQADAEWLAGLIGTVPTWQTTIRTEGYGRHTSEGTRTRGYRFEVNPSELQRLAAGEAYVARLDEVGSCRARRARVVPPWRRLPPSVGPDELLQREQSPRV